MRETQKNIRAYKKRLVGVKEKLATAGLLFLMSAVMLTTASFAWITLSVAPEVSGIETTIAGNGNLEIALASTSDEGSLLRPEESQVGDGALEDLLERNVTWGNLINLNDPRYGIENAVLKPATLYRENLLLSPLEAVEYSGDGRIIKKNYNFKYTNYNPTLNSNQGDFEYTSVMKYGVRAISSVHQDSDNTETLAKYESLKNLQRQVGEYYTTTIENNKEVIAEILGLYVADKANQMLADDKSPLSYKQHVPDMIVLMDEFIKCLDNAFYLYDEFAKIQYSASEELQQYDFPYQSIDDLKTKSEGAIKNALPAMGGLNKLIEIYNRTVKNVTSLRTKYSTMDDIFWADISSEINALVNIATCKIDDELEVGTLGMKDAAKLMDMLKNENVVRKGTIKGGDVKDFEKLIGGRIDLYVEIPADLSRVSGYLWLMGIYKSQFNIKAQVATDVTAPYTTDTTIENVALIMNGNNPVVWIADDTYGLVLDFWLRTNASNSYAVLEGKSITDSVVATKQIDNKDYLLFYNRFDKKTYYYIPDSSSDNQYNGDRVYKDGISATEIQVLENFGEFVNNSNGQHYSFMDYDQVIISTPVTESTSGLIYDISSKKVTIEPIKEKNAKSYEYTINQSTEWQTISEPSINLLSILDTDSITLQVREVYGENSYSDTATLSINPSIINKTRIGFVDYLTYVEKTVVVGYDGANRIWQESSELPENITTQGNGSCYIFYPKDPIEQEQILSLLKGLSIAFIDEDSVLLSVAVLNTENAYEENGKVTVPLELDPEYSKSVTIGMEQKLVVTELERGEAKFITAIVYIDGQKITNQDAGAASDIFGNLNIQFGSTEELNHLDNEELKNEIYTISGELAGNGSSKLSFDFDPNNLPTTSVQIRVSGITPTNVKANFSRIVNGSQGVKGDNITFIYDEDSNVWEGIAVFDRPGDYVLRSVWLDGVEYNLTDDQELTVNVSGFNITNITWTENNSTVYHMVSDYTYLVNDITVHFAAKNTYTPEKVQGLFRNTENGTYTTVSFNDNGNQSWSGVAAFTSSGTYILETLLIDDEAHSVEKSFQKTIVLFLGMNALVSPEYTTLVYEGQSFEVPVSVSIYDVNDEEINDFSNVYLRYQKVGTREPLITELKWNESKKKYQGLFLIEKQGRYEFNSIGINKTVANPDNLTEMNSLSSYLKSAVAPDISLLPKDPPAYESFSVIEEQYSPSNSATLNVTITNSSAASGAAVLYHEESKSTHIVEIPNKNIKPADDGNTATWIIDIPNLPDSTINNKNVLGQNGTWTLKQMYLSDVYVNNQMYEYEENEEHHWKTEGNTDDFIVISIPEGNTTHVISDFVVYIANENTTKFEKTVFTTTLSNPYSRSSTIAIRDFYGNPTDYVSINPSATTLTYSLKAVDWWTNSKDIIGESPKYTNNYNLSDGIISSTASFQYAGRYTPSMVLSITDVNQTIYSYAISNSDSGITVSPLDEAVDMIVARTFVGDEVVQWEQPQAKWKSVSPDENTPLYYGVHLAEIGQGILTRTMRITHTSTINNVKSDKNILVYMRIKDGTKEWNDSYKKDVTYGRLSKELYSYVDIVPSSASIEVQFLGEHSGAKASVNDNTIVFNIEPSNSESGLSAIGTGYDGSGKIYYSTAQNPTSLINPVAPGSTITSIEVNYGEGKTPYKFDFVEPITINSGKTTGW